MLGAGLVWGSMPIYFKLLAELATIEIVAYRVLWSVPLLLAIVWMRKRLHALRDLFRDRRSRGFLLASSLFIAANWIIYVFAVNADQVVAASLGYFINPLSTVLLGALFLKDRLNRNQWIALAVAGAGVAALAIDAWQTLWISLALAGSWGCYGLVRKVAGIPALTGLAAETMIIAPFAIAYVAWLVASGTGHQPGADIPLDLLLMAGALITATPLLLFNSAVSKLSFTALGFLQYIAPTIQFLIGWLLYDEALTRGHLICFALIWLSLVIYTHDAIQRERKVRRAVPV